MSPKDLIDTLSSQAHSIFSKESSLLPSEIETQIRALLHSTFNKLDLVSREEFDSQMIVLVRTRARLEELEKKVIQLEKILDEESPAMSDELLS
ncbi:UNVERIFIED_CONTAM: hypothetical protein GTU68_060421 [Idotea baltica]|nr:hypothetical protein [Idotea baltica]